MAMNFDLNSALAGANSAASLIDKVYYAPERHKMEKDRNDLAMRQGEAALDLSKFQLGTAKNEQQRVDDLRTLSGKEAETFKNQLKFETFKKWADKPGLFAAVGTAKGDPEVLISAASNRQAMHNAYGSILEKGTVDEYDGAVMQKGIAELYALTTHEDIKPEDVKVSLKEGKVSVVNKRTGATLNQFDSPSDMMKMIDGDYRGIEDTYNDIQVLKAKLGDKEASKVLQEQVGITQQAYALQKRVGSSRPDIQGQLNAIPAMNPAIAQKHLERISAEVDKFEKSKEMTAFTKLITTEAATEIKKLNAMPPGSAKADAAEKLRLALGTRLTSDPIISGMAASMGLNVQQEVNKMLDPDFKNSISIGELKVKEQQVGVARDAARNKGTDNKTSSEIIDKRIARNTELLKGYIALGVLIPPEDIKKKARLEKAIQDDQALLNGASYTPSGKRAERVAQPKDRFTQDLNY